MNIQEAMNSGKKYRRSSDKMGWYHPPADYPHYKFTVEQVLSDDWEVEEKSVTITREQLEEAWLKSLSLKELAKELGL